MHPIFLAAGFAFMFFRAMCPRHPDRCEGRAGLLGGRSNSRRCCGSECRFRDEAAFVVFGPFGAIFHKIYGSSTRTTGR